MRCLIIDVENLGLDFAARCVAADHEVRWFRESKKPIKDGKGFRGIQIIDDWRSSMAWAKQGLIITTGNAKYCKELDRFRELGFKIFGPTQASADLEIKRSVGLEAMEKAGIDVPHYETFNSLKEAETWARKQQDPFVFKPGGDLDDKSMTFCADDPADLVGWLQRQQARGKTLKGTCLLQERIDMLEEVGVSGWFGPDGFLPDKWQTCFENKRLMPGDIGPNTGEMGTVTAYQKSDKMAEEILMPLEPMLKKLGHRGDFAVGCGIDKKGKAWPFEFTARLGWPAFFLQICSHKNDDPAQWMRDLLDGKDELSVSYDPCVGVVMAQPRFPYNDSPPELVEGNPVTGLEGVWDAIHPCSIMIGKGPVFRDGKVTEDLIYLTAGEYVLVACAQGNTVTKAQKSVYKIVDQIKFGSALYRNDIGDRAIKQLPKIQEFGWALGIDP